MKKRLFVAALAVFALFMMGCTKEIANEDNKNVSDNNDNLIECDNCNNGCNDGDACDCYNGCNCNDDCDDLTNFASQNRTRSLMDKIKDSGSLAQGSIPCGFTAKRLSALSLFAVYR